MRTRHRRQSGFTLLEVLIVAGLLAVLAAFVVPSLFGRSERVRKNLALAAVSSSGPIATAIDNFKLDIGRYPKELEELYTQPDDDQEAEKWDTEGYIKDKDTLVDPWGEPYQYRYPGQYHEKSYDLWSTGPDREDGTDDDIVNWKTDR